MSLKYHYCNWSICSNSVLYTQMATRPRKPRQCASNTSNKLPPHTEQRRERPPCDPYEPTMSWKQRCLTLAEIEAFGMSRESWCQVEGQSQQSWNRTNRKHYAWLYEDHVFDKSPAPEQELEVRCTWKTGLEKHDEMRHHFPGRSV